MVKEWLNLRSFLVVEPSAVRYFEILKMQQTILFLTEIFHRKQHCLKSKKMGLVSYLVNLKVGFNKVLVTGAVIPLPLYEFLEKNAINKIHFIYVQ